MNNSLTYNKKIINYRLSPHILYFSRRRRRQVGTFPVFRKQNCIFLVIIKIHLS